MASRTAYALPAAQVASAFDPTTHKPPRVDQFGYNKETHKGRELLNRNAKNALTEDVKVPTWWVGKRIRDKNFGSGSLSLAPGEVPRSSSFGLADTMPAGSRGMLSKLNASPPPVVVPEKMTKTKLLAERRAEMVPHISYDLDGDGFVGGRDYVVARRFDEGVKNYLTQSERKKAFDALKNVSKLLILTPFLQGFEHNYTWDVEASGGGGRPYRIMQKRGAMVDAEDFADVTATYPKHPMCDVVPDHANQTELIEHRKHVEREDIKAKKGARDAKVAHLQKVQFKDYY